MAGVLFYCVPLHSQSRNSAWPGAALHPLELQPGWERGANEEIMGNVCKSHQDKPHSVPSQRCSLFYPHPQHSWGTGGHQEEFPLILSSPQPLWKACWRSNEASPGWCWESGVRGWILFPGWVSLLVWGFFILFLFLKAPLKCLAIN